MLQLRAYAPPERAESVGQRLAAIAGVRHVIIGGRTAGDMVQLTGEVDVDAADVVLQLLRECDLAADDVVLWRTNSIQPLDWRRRRRTRSGHDSAVWAEVTGRATEHARTALVYVLLMATAGIVAGVGVLNGSAILVVGAMALSPDLLPISATAVGFVERRWSLAGRAALTLAIGLVIVIAAAAGATLVLRIFGRIDSGLELADTALGPSLTELGPGTVLVALAAGVAGMLAYETAAGAAVGVAISVTTIPAAAYIGCSVALPSSDQALGALEVLTTNVVCIIAGSSLTLLVQSRHSTRLQRHPAPTVFTGRRATSP